MNEQEKFWMDTFGTEYIDRNKLEKLCRQYKLICENTEQMQPNFISSGIGL